MDEKQRVSRVAREVDDVAPLGLFELHSVGEPREQVRT
jgi:hypothetical protein